MNEDFIKVQAPYWLRLREHLLSEGFTASVHTEREDVMDILEISLRFLSNLFEDWCVQNIRSSKDIGKIIWKYSFYERDSNSGIQSLKEEDVIALYTFRYILSIAPKLCLSSQSEPYFKDNNICLPELFSIAYIIGLLNQFRCVEGLSNKSVVSINLAAQFIGVDYIDDGFNNLLHLSKIKGNKIIAPAFIDYDTAVKFDDILREVFGDAASLLLDAMLIDNVAMFPSDDNVTPKDFTPYLIIFGDSVFAQELILNEKCVDFYKVITKPHSTNYRTRFKPLIQLHVDGKTVLVSSKWLLFEAYSELTQNRLPFEGLPKSWLKFDKIKAFANKTHDNVGKQFELFVKNQISDNFKFKYDIKSIGKNSVEKYPVIENDIDTGRTVGQIDIIILNEELHIIYIADAKHLKSKYITTSFYNDKSKFDEYYIKLLDKAVWAKNHRDLISELFKTDVSNFEVQECFITDAYIFYALFVDYPIVPVKFINDYLSTNDRLCYLK